MRDSKAKMDFRRQDDGGCKACPFSEPGKGDASNPVYQNPPSTSDPDCFDKSTEAFLSSLNVVSAGSSGDITAQDCKALADIGVGNDIFYALYYLDKTYCGLGQAHSAGDDPSINSILTNCSHYGISSLADPGWPSSSYQCTICLSTTEQSAETASATVSAPAASTTKAEMTSQGSSSPSEASSSTSLTVPTSGSDSTTTSLLTAPTAISDASSSASSDHRIPTQGIVAIAVCTSLAIAAALVLLFCVLRRRRKQLEAYSSGMSSRISRITSEFIPPGGNTYEPLISHSHSISVERPPLTPPPRLCDRKLLPPLLRPLSRSETLVFGPPLGAAHHSSSSSLYSMTQSVGGAKHEMSTVQSQTATTVGRASASLPSSLVCAPTSNTMEPRQKRMQAEAHTHTPASPEPPSSPPYTRLKSPPPVSFTFPPRTSLDTTATSRCPPTLPVAHKGRHRRGTTATSTARHPFASTNTSVSSSTCGDQDYNGTTTTTTNSIIPGSSSGGGGGSSSPIRPRRPHETPLEIPDLVTPRSASPAPTKPLPRPPASAPTPSPSIGIARTTGLPLPPPRPRDGSISLHSLAEQHRRERDSWGSWGDEEEEEEDKMATGTGSGRIFGVSFPPGGGGGASGGV